MEEYLKRPCRKANAMSYAGAIPANCPKKYKAQLIRTHRTARMLLVLLIPGSQVAKFLGEAVFNEYFYQANLEEEDSVYPAAVARSKRYIK